MRQPLRCFVFALLLLTFTTANGFAQTVWSEPYGPLNGKPTVGSYLENEFSAVLKQCTVDKLVGQVKKYGFNANVDLSAVPLVLQSELSLNQPKLVRAQFDQSGASLFAYVVSGPALENQTFDQSRYMLADMVADPQTFFPNGWSTTVYKHNCASIISAAANASAGMSLPWASAKAALSNQFRGSEITSLELAAGRFNSPLRTLLLSLDEADRLFGNFVVWQWYVKNPAAVGKDNRYIGSFNGLVVFRTSETTRSYDGKINLQGGINAAGIASLNSTVAADLANADHTRSNRYSTAFLVDDARTPNPQIFSFPPLDDALSAIERARATQLGSYDQVLKADLSNQVTYTIAGLPSSLCNSTSSWRTETDAGAKFTTTVDSVAVDGNPAPNGKATCKFTIGFKPTTALLNERADTLRLSYRLVTASGVGDKHAKIEAQPVQFTATRAPYLLKKSYNDAFKATPWQQGTDSGFNLSWEVPLGIDDGGDPINWTAAITPASAPNNPQLTCRGRTESIDLDMQAVLPTAGTAGGTGGVVALLSRKVYAGEGVDPKLDAPCTLGGSIRIRMGGTPLRTAERPFPPNIELRYPKAVQATPAPPAPVAGSNTQPAPSAATPPPSAQQPPSQQPAQQPPSQQPAQQPPTQQPTQQPPTQQPTQQPAPNRPPSVQPPPPPPPPTPQPQ